MDIVVAVMFYARTTDVYKARASGGKEKKSLILEASIPAMGMEIRLDAAGTSIHRTPHGTDRKEPVG